MRTCFVLKFVIKTVFIVLPACCSIIAKAQLTDNSSSFRNIHHTSYFRLLYDNDYFTKTDRYYSQGVTLEYVHPSVKKMLPAKLLWKPYTTHPQFGVTFNIFAYTPTSIVSDTILFDDRPFNAIISFKIFLLQEDTIHQQRVSTAFSAGIMGPAALGEEIQNTIHRWVDDPRPRGWKNQIQNDIIINYQLNYEKKLLGESNNFLLCAAAEARLGTLNTKISGGFNFMAGRFNKRFSPRTYNNKKVEYYFYGQSRLHFIGYDATMQGGLFNRKSPYTISAGDISRVVFQADAGIVVNFKKWNFSYSQSFLTKEFRTGKYHRWGGLSAGFAL